MTARERLALRNALRTLGRSHQGFFFRIVPYARRYAPLSSFLTELYGSRYNPGVVYDRKRGFGAIYLANTPEHSLVEIEAYDNGKPRAIEPKALLTIEARLSHVVDLCDHTTQTALGVTYAQLTASWRLAQLTGGSPITQEIGCAARAVGVEGLLVPSASVAGAFNLVVIESNLLTTSVVRIYDPNPTLRFGRDALTGHVEPAR